MLKPVIEFMKVNKKQLIKGGLVTLGTVGGAMLINKLIKVGSIELSIDNLDDEDSEETEDDSDEDETE